MDPRTNPYAPGAGTIPPELAGRDELFDKIFVAIDRCKNGYSTRGFLFVGLRGVGKTVLLTKVAQDAEREGFIVVSIEVPEKRSLPSLLIPGLRSALLKLNRLSGVEEFGKKTLRILGSFVSAMKLKYEDIEFGLDLGVEEGIADSGDLEHDLVSLFLEVGKAAKEKKTALILCLDEIQYLQKDEFSALIMAIHKCTQSQLPILLIGAGLPQLIAQAGKAKSYAERLFEYPEIGPLTKEEAIKALTVPVEKLGVYYSIDALDEIINVTNAYPYFLQEWGKHSWASAKQSPITHEDVTFATTLAITELDSSFFRVRFDRLTPSEKKYCRAMAEIGSDAIRSGDIAALLNKEVQAVAPIRASLIKKGMIYSKSHGDNNFTVPLFDTFMKRIIPEFNSKD